MAKTMNKLKAFLKKVFSGIHIPVKVKVEFVNQNPNKELYDEIIVLMDKHRKKIRTRFDLPEDTQADHYYSDDSKKGIKDGEGFGICMWIETQIGHRHVEVMAIDKPEVLLRTYSDQLSRAIQVIIKSEPDKNKVDRILERGLGSKPIVIKGNMGGDCPVHGKDCPDRPKEKPIGVA